MAPFKSKYRRRSNSQAVYRRNDEWIPPSNTNFGNLQSRRSTRVSGNWIINKERRHFMWISKRFEMHKSGLLLLNNREKQHYLDELEYLFPILDIGENSDVVTLRQKIENLDVSTAPIKPKPRKKGRLVDKDLEEIAESTTRSLIQNEIEPKSGDNYFNPHSIELFSDTTQSTIVNQTPLHSESNNQLTANNDIELIKADISTNPNPENVCHHLDVRDDIQLFKNLIRLHEVQPLATNFETSLNSVSQFDVDLLTNQNFVTNQDLQTKAEIEESLTDNKCGNACKADEMISECDSVDVCSLAHTNFELVKNKLGRDLFDHSRKVVNEKMRSNERKINDKQEESDIFYPEKYEVNLICKKTTIEKKQNCSKRRHGFDFNRRFGSEKSVIMIEEVDSDDVCSESGKNNSKPVHKINELNCIPNTETATIDRKFFTHTDKLDQETALFKNHKETIKINDKEIYSKTAENKDSDIMIDNAKTLNNLIPNIEIDKPKEIISKEQIDNIEISAAIGNLKINEEFISGEVTEQTGEKLQNKFANSKVDTETKIVDNLEDNSEDDKTLDNMSVIPETQEICDGGKSELATSDVSFDFLTTTPVKVKRMSEEEMSELVKGIDAKIAKVEAAGVLDETFLDLLSDVNKCVKDTGLRMVECLNKLDEKEVEAVKTPLKEEINPFFFDADTMVLPEEEPEQPEVLISNQEYEEELRQLNYSVLKHQALLSRLVVEESDSDCEVPDWRELFPNYR